ncbi:MAG: hypothetical protein GY702_08160 [Desulfobulbaceae bacterium]|nr:hypothetical protein [Desulfobulbaceae bacterium]
MTICINKNNSLSDLAAIQLAFLNDLTANQVKGLAVLIKEYNLSSQKNSFRKLFCRIIELSKKTDDPVQSVIYLTNAFKVALDLLPKLKKLMTPQALSTLTKMLLHGGPTDKFSSTLGVFHCLKTILDNPARFGLDGKRFAILVEVSDMGNSRFVDILFYALDDVTTPATIKKIDPNKVLRSVEVKWYLAKSDIESQHLQLLFDVERSVRRGKYLDDVTWMVPQDYPQGKIHDLINLVDANLYTFLRESIPELSFVDLRDARLRVFENLANKVFQKADVLRTFVDNIVKPDSL